MLRLARRGYLKPFKKFASPILKKIPIIGFLLDFLMNLFIFSTYNCQSKKVQF